MTRPRRLWLALGVISLLALLSLGAAAFVSSTERGRRWVADRIERAVSDAIPGRLEIGAITDLGPPVRARDVRFIHPDGRVILFVKQAEIEPDLGQALQKRLAFKRAWVDGGRMLLSVDPDGRASIESMMDAPTKPGEPSDPMGGLHYALMSMHVQNFTVVAELSDSKKYTLEGVEGFVAVRRIETSGARVFFDRIKAKNVEPGLLGARTQLESVDGWVHGKEEHVLHLDVETRLAKGQLDAQVDYFDREKNPVRIQVMRSEGIAAKLLTELADVGDTLLGDSLAVERTD